MNKIMAEQRRAIKELRRALANTSAHVNPIPTGRPPNTDFTTFSETPIDCRSFWSDNWWKWNQSHHRIKIDLGDITITFRKINPKKSNVQNPGYKIWIFFIEDQRVGNFWFVWCERGLPAWRPLMYETVEVISEGTLPEIVSYDEVYSELLNCL